MKNIILYSQLVSDDYTHNKSIQTKKKLASLEGWWDNHKPEPLRIEIVLVSIHQRM